MAGPVGSVLLPQHLTNPQHGQLESTLRAISLNVKRDTTGSFDFQVGTTHPLGGSYFDSAHGSPFGMTMEPADAWREAEELSSIEENFGFSPEQSLEFYAMCNSADDHKILGLLLLHFARLFNGIVSFNGALLPPLPEMMYDNGWIFYEANWSDVAPYFDGMVDGMSGKVISIEYQTSQTRTWASHVADAEFMESWLRHPHFHMIK